MARLQLFTLIALAASAPVKDDLDVLLLEEYEDVDEGREMRMLEQGSYIGSYETPKATPAPITPTPTSAPTALPTSVPTAAPTKLAADNDDGDDGSDPCSPLYQDARFQSCLKQNPDSDDDVTLNKAGCTQGCQDFIMEIRTCMITNSDPKDLEGGSTEAFKPVFNSLYVDPCTSDPEKPVFDATKFELSSMAVATSFIPSSSNDPPPTPTPLAPATGFKVVTKTVVKKAVKVALSFPLTAAEAADPKMQLSLRQGFASSLGLDEDRVQIAKVNGVAVGNRRLADTEIEFNVISNAADTSKLEANIKSAATEGSIVANIQKAAHTNNVLTQALYDMPRSLPEPSVESTTVSVVIQVYEKASAPAAPTPAPEVLGGASATSISSAVLLSALFCQTASVFISV